MKKSLLKTTILIAISLLFSNFCYGKARTLIKYKKGKITPALALKATKLEEGKYQFDLDPEAKISGNKPLTPTAVKNSLESKLGKRLGLKVKEEGATTVIVTYTSDEKKFLKRVAKVRIKAKKSVALALETSVSDGGIRAKTAERDPKDDEIKAKIIKIEKDSLVALVIKAGKSKVASKARPGKKITITGMGGFSAKKGDTIFFTPEMEKDNQFKGSNFLDK